MSIILPHDANANGRRAGPSIAHVFPATLGRLPALVWVTDRKLRVTAIGGGALGALALTPDGLIGRSVLEALGASDERDPVIQSHHRALDGRTAAVRYLWRRKHYLIRLQPLEPTGKRRGACLGVAIDVTPRRQSHGDHLVVQSIHENGGNGAEAPSPAERRNGADSARPHRADSLEPVHWVYDVRGGCTIFLAGDFQAIWGESPASRLGVKTPPIVGDAQESAPYEFGGWQCSSDSIGQLKEVEVHRSDGTTAWVQNRSYPIVDARGRAAYLGGVAEDVTHHKLADANRRGITRLASLGVAAAGIVHEVNSPIASALASANAALRYAPQDGPPELRDSLRNVLASIERCSETVGSLTSLCRDTPAARSRIELGELVQSALSISELKELPRNCCIETALPARPARIPGNAMQLKIALINLVRNAVDANSSRVRIAVRKRGDWMELRVSDNGHGLRICNLDDLPPLFGVRSDQTGIGLTVVKAIIAHHGGTITGAANRPRGCVIIVRLPRRVK